MTGQLQSREQAAGASLSENPGANPELRGKPRRGFALRDNEAASAANLGGTAIDLAPIFGAGYIILSLSPALFRKYFERI